MTNSKNFDKAIKRCKGSSDARRVKHVLNVFRKISLAHGIHEDAAQSRLLVKLARAIQSETTRRAA